jgi:hypothetical protein
MDLGVGDAAASAPAYAHAVKMDEAKTALAEARRLNPKLTVKWMIEHTPNPKACRGAASPEGSIHDDGGGDSLGLVSD